MLQVPMLNVATAVAVEAGKIIVRAMDRLDKITVIEKQAHDYVTNVDQEVEKLLIDAIRKTYPHHNIISEEAGELKGTEPYTWVIDPVDGTHNFMHGIPHFAISIGILYGDVITHGLIYDPVHQELFTASRGRGAMVNQQRLRVSAQKVLAGAMIGTGFSQAKPRTMDAYLSGFSRVMREKGSFRRSGSAALDLAYVAAGRLDAFWELDLAPWDMAAGALLVREAGGLVCSATGGEDFLSSGHIVAGNAKLARALLNEIHL